MPSTTRGARQVGRPFGAGKRDHWFTRLCKFWSDRVRVKDTRRLMAGMNEKDIELMHRNIYFTNLKIEPWEVMLAAFMTFAIALMVMVPYLLGMLMFLDDAYSGYPDPMLVVILGLFPVLIIPLLMLLVLMRYPASYSHRLRIRSFTSQIDVLNFLSMSMRLKPSLEEAVNFASENVEEPMATGLHRVLWDVYTRKYESVEQSLTAFAIEWGEFNENFKRALFIVVSAQLETTLEGRQHTLQRANDLIIQGNKQILDEHRARLGGPTMIMFSICILLPLIISTILPMLTMLNMRITTVHIAFLLDFLVPMVSFLYAWRILSKRPEAVRPPRVESNATTRTTLMYLGLSVVSGIATFAAVRWLGGLTRYSELLFGMAVACGIGAPLALYAFLTSREQKKVRAHVLKVEEKLPDALFQLGSRIVEGAPLELAMQTVGEVLATEDVGRELTDISYRLQISKKPAEDILFGDDGYLTNHPSALLRSTMGIVIRSTSKDAITAGKIIIETSNYVRDLKKAESDIRIAMTEQVSNMQNTAVIFGPVSLGITTSMYLLMMNTFEGMNLSSMGDSQMSMFDPRKAIPLWGFSMIIGMYLILSLLVIIYFSTGILYGDDNVERKHTMSRAIPVALLIYAVSFLLGNTLVG